MKESLETVAKFEHPFASVVRTVLKEKYPDRALDTANGSSPAASDLPEDVIAEAMKRYSTGKKWVISPHVKTLPDENAPKQKVGYTITYA